MLAASWIIDNDNARGLGNLATLLTFLAMTREKPKGAN
jgi:hypothetical protein